MHVYFFCRSFQNFISNVDPDTLATMSSGKSGEVPPEMVKTASNMISKMSPGELQKMLELASSFQGENPYFMGGSSENNSGSFKPTSVPPNVTPDMLKTASDMMNRLPPEDLQKMFEMASSLKGTDSVPTAATVKGVSDTGTKSSEAQETPLANRSVVGESSSSRGMFSNSRTTTAQSSLPSSTPDLQEQMRNQMKDPAMRQVCSFYESIN